MSQRKISLILLLLISILVFVDSRSSKFIEQFIFDDDVSEMINNAGYKFELHEVQTEDGYILKLHRIPTKNKTSIQKHPVFLMHGMGTSPSDFIQNGPEVALAYLLSDNGYDVWLGNTRGSKHSMHHKTFEIDSKEYWNFSWHEIAIYDLPAFIDYVLFTTNDSKLFYAGYSQGSTVLLVLLSTRPEYNSIILQAHMLGPVAFMKNAPHRNLQIMTNPFFQKFIDRFGMFKNPQYLSVFKVVSLNVCREPTASLCYEMISYLFGQSSLEERIDSTVMEQFYLHISPFIALKQGIHYIQLVKSQRFRPFDYLEKNLDYYNTLEPPDYNLTNVKSPVYLYHAQNDTVVSRLDVDKLRSQLSNVPVYRIIKNWSHINFIAGKNARKSLYSHVVNSMNTE